MALAVKTVNAASTGIDAITKLVAQAKSVANQALQTKVSSATNSATVVAAGSTAIGTGKNLDFKIGDTTTSITLSTAIASAGDLKTALSGKVSGLTVSIASGDITFSVASGENFSVSGAAAALVLGSNLATSTDGANRDDFQKSYNDLLTQIDELATDATYNGVNLLQSGTTLTVNFNETQTSTLDISGVNFSASGLGLSSVTDWSTDAKISATTSSLDSAKTTLRTQASTFGSNLAVVQNRQDFTKDMINTLQAGAAGLTLADTNLEGANLLALQTRQSLATTALSLSNQAQSSILSILR
jgi:flagellin-like hook-associated protein FlgL